MLNKNNVVSQVRATANFCTTSTNNSDKLVSDMFGQRGVEYVSQLNYMK